MTDAIAKARAAAERAKRKEQDARRHATWIITRPGEEPFEVILQPPQELQWVLDHYQGCGVVRG